MPVLEVRAAHAGHVAIGWNCDRRQHFITFQHCRKQIFEKLSGRNLTLAFGSGCCKRRIQSRDQRRIVRGRVRVGDAAPDRAAVAYLRIGDQRRGFCQDRARDP